MFELIAAAADIRAALACLARVDELTHLVRRGNAEAQRTCTQLLADPRLPCCLPPLGYEPLPAGDGWRICHPALSSLRGVLSALVRTIVPQSDRQPDQTTP